MSDLDQIYASKQGSGERAVYRQTAGKQALGNRHVSLGLPATGGQDSRPRGRLEPWRWISRARGPSTAVQGPPALGAVRRPGDVRRFLVPCFRKVTALPRIPGKDGVLAVHYWSANEVVFTRNRRDAWAEVFKEWRKIVDEYTEVTDDLAYWNTEISNLSFLTAAIWRARMVAVQEFSTPRIADNGRARGRADLWASIGDASYLLEAKIVWLHLDSKESIRYLAAEVSNACEEVIDYQEFYDFCGGIVFGVTNTVKPNELNSRAMAWRKASRAQLRDISSHGIVADYFPARSQKVLTNGKRLYPGVTIVVGVARSEQT